MVKEYPKANYKEYRESRNPYAPKIRELELAPGPKTILVDESSEKNRGEWRKFFARDGLLNLELGAYHGETSIHLASNAPENLHVAIEWKFKQCYKAGKKARDKDLENLTFLRANIARLPWVFAPGELDRVWILFPDPWSKTNQQKWRLLQPGFFHMLGALLKEGKELLIKTDHADYATFIADSLQEANCFSPMDQELAASRWALIPPTPFERIFMRQGKQMHSFALVRNANPVTPPEEVQQVLAGS